MLHFLHTFIPSPVFLQLGPFTIYWYGLIAAIAILLAWVVINYLAKKYNIEKDLFNLYFGLIIAALIGARLYHVVNEFGYYSVYPQDIIKIWQGGLALHGGIIGALLYGWWWVRRNKLSFPLLLDIFAPAGILIQALGRWGNYFNQELFGKPTDLPWGIPILPFNRPSGFEAFTYFHPTFLYESILNFVILIILLSLHKLRLTNKINIRHGSIFLVYFASYSFVRFIVEFIRIDQTPIILGWRLPQIVSIVIILFVIVIAYKTKSVKKAN